MHFATNHSFSPAVNHGALFSALPSAIVFTPVQTNRTKGVNAQEFEEKKTDSLLRVFINCRNMIPYLRLPILQAFFLFCGRHSG